MARAAKLLKAAAALAPNRSNGHGGNGGEQQFSEADREIMARMEERLVTAPRPAIDNRRQMVTQIAAQTLSVCASRSTGDFRAWGATIKGRLAGLRKSFEVQITLPDGASRMVCDLIVRQLGDRVRARINDDNSITVTPA